MTTTTAMRSNRPAAGPSFRLPTGVAVFAGDDGASATRSVSGRVAADADGASVRAVGAGSDESLADPPAPGPGRGERGARGRAAWAAAPTAVGRTAGRVAWPGPGRGRDCEAAGIGWRVSGCAAAGASATSPPDAVCVACDQGVSSCGSASGSGNAGPPSSRSSDDARRRVHLLLRVPDAGGAT